jgi:F-type H+-transporting ATPase subunit c
MRKYAWYLMVLTSMVLMAPAAFAADQPAATPATNWIKVLTGFAMAIASAGGALGQGIATGHACEGLARNPGAEGAIRFALILGLILMESMALYTFAIVAVDIFFK